MLFYQRDSLMNSDVIPEISFKNYLFMIFSYLPMCLNTYIAAFIYIDRFYSSGISPTDFNIHKVILVSVLLASKFHEDQSPDNHFFAYVGGIHLKELNLIESDFLNSIDYKLHIEESFFEEYKSHVTL